MPISRVSCAYPSPCESVHIKIFVSSVSFSHNSVRREPMRAKGPKERPTAVLCVQLSARYVQIRQTAKIRNTTP